MRRIFVLVSLLVMMLGLRALKVDPIGAGDPLTLAAIGFVVLAAFTIAEVGLSLSLPLFDQGLDLPMGDLVPGGEELPQRQRDHQVAGKEQGVAVIDAVL